MLQWYDGYGVYARSWVRGFLGHSHTRGQHSGQRSSVASYQNIHGIILDDLVAASATKNARKVGGTVGWGIESVCKYQCNGSLEQPKKSISGKLIDL